VQSSSSLRPPRLPRRRRTPGTHSRDALRIHQMRRDGCARCSMSGEGPYGQVGAHRALRSMALRLGAQQYPIRPLHVRAHNPINRATWLFSLCLSAEHLTNHSFGASYPPPSSHAIIPRHHPTSAKPTTGRPTRRGLRTLLALG
jgi:hypothetical protein